MYTDPEVEMILCARGGWGGLRMVDKIDYDLIMLQDEIINSILEAFAWSIVWKNSNIGQILFSVYDLNFNLLDNYELEPGNSSYTTSNLELKNNKQDGGMGAIAQRSVGRHLKRMDQEETAKQLARQMAKQGKNQVRE